MFQLCQSCQRHIKANRCPFCGSTEVAPVARKPLDAARLSRSQLLGAVAVAGTLSVTACGDDNANSAVFYGGPPSDYDAGGSTSGAPIYGSPALDAGNDASSSGALPEDDAGDAAPDDAGDTDASDAETPDAG